MRSISFIFWASVCILASSADADLPPLPNCSRLLLPAEIDPLTLGPAAMAYRETIHNGMALLLKDPTPAAIEELAMSLLHQSQEALREAGVPFRLTQDRRGLIVLPDKQTPLGRLADKFGATTNNYTLYYYPSMLLTDISRIDAPLLQHRFPGILLSHTDLLTGGRSVFLARQIELLTDFHGKSRTGTATTKTPAMLSFSAKMESLFNPFETTSNWPTERKQEASRTLIELAQTILRESGDTFHISDDGLSIEIAAAQIGSLSSYAQELTRFYGRSIRFVYDPMRTLDFDVATGFEDVSPFINTMDTEDSGVIYLFNNEVAMGRRRWGSLKDNQSNRNVAFRTLNARLREYIRRKPGVPFLQSTDEPIVLSIKPGSIGPFVGELVDRPSGASIHNLFSDPYFGSTTVIDSPRGIDKFLGFNWYLWYTSIPSSREWIGNAVQLDSNRTFYQIDLSRFDQATGLLQIGSYHTTIPLFYRKAHDSYLEFLKTVYQNRLGISDSQFEVLRQISKKVQKRTTLFAFTRNPIATKMPDGSFRSLLFDGIQPDQLDEPYRSHPEFYASAQTSNWDFISGVLLVTSRSAREKLPMELLHGFELPRGKSGIAEIGRMGAIETEEAIEYAKAAAVFLRAKRPNVKTLYIEVDEIRKRAFSHYGFKEIKTAHADLGYYPSGTDFILAVDIDDFLVRALGVR